MSNDTSNIGEYFGVGIDITDVARIKKMLDNYGRTFIEHTFTEAEITYCEKFAQPEIHFAARFAAKEAMVKALGTGFSDGISLKSVSVENHPQTSAPIAVLNDVAKERMQSLGAKKMLISITHLKDYAQAIAILSK